MKRCSFSSFTRRPLMPAWRDSTSSMTSRTVAPFASTDFSPPVWVRRIVGMETVTAMGSYLRWVLTRRRRWRGGLFRRNSADDLDRLLGNLGVHDPVRPELVLFGDTKKDKHVVRVRLGRDVRVGPR